MEKNINLHELYNLCFKGCVALELIEFGYNFKKGIRYCKYTVKKKNIKKLKSLCEVKGNVDYIGIDVDFG